jgi:hypothetical protein
MGSGEWGRRTANTTYNPIRVTIAVGWQQQQRIATTSPSGRAEFTYTPSTQTLVKGTTVTNPARFEVGPDANNDGVIESSAMLTVVITCR